MFGVTKLSKRAWRRLTAEFIQQSGGHSQTYNLGGVAFTLSEAGRHFAC